eukprot:g39828.t1
MQLGIFYHSHLAPGHGVQFAVSSSGSSRHIFASVGGSGQSNQPGHCQQQRELLKDSQILIADRVYTFINLRAAFLHLVCYEEITLLSRDESDDRNLEFTLDLRQKIKKSCGTGITDKSRWRKDGGFPSLKGITDMTIVQQLQ